MYIINEILSISDERRYVAINRNGLLESRSKEGKEDASSTESNRYEKLLVNPTLIKLGSQPWQHRL
ncbi:hypothetical protein GWO43_25930 [candidate division KSB1 bacterium]|nr:hypothetical protein [candidate division KSB1 bacterium]NIR69252.1 hypothetical protein [candidate division KSB1 bacterium]NIT74251.1 hypothetical protein [candidate division KSB1 bacterium]NIU28143.1 hypothetical protein [candidate division KSB1 bacterium]NIU90285.1 hypothetical protein [candidate division KSB1 bacterium]